MPQLYGITKDNGGGVGGDLRCWSEKRGRTGDSVGLVRVNGKMTVA